MQTDILKKFSEHGTFIQPDALDHIMAQEQPEDYTTHYLSTNKQLPLILTKKELLSYEKKEHSKDQEPLITNPAKQAQHHILKQLYDPKPTHPEEETQEQEDIGTELNSREHKTEEEPTIDIKKVHSWHPAAKDYTSDVKILKDITGKSTCQGKTEDFKKLFQHRYETITALLKKQRRELGNLISINRINDSTTDLCLIGIVNEIKTTKNGHKRIELEDETGSTTIMVLKDHDVYDKATLLMNDEVIGITGTLSKNGDLIIAKNIIYPDIKMHNERNSAYDPVFAAFASDIHVGSNAFMQDQWNAFLKWINGDLGNSRQREVAGRIKYLILPGDVVDGIGIYPGQEDDLTIANLTKQYEELATQLQQIPDHITIIMQPGNHDAVRPAEPQPTFSKDIRELFTGGHYLFLGNPSTFTVHDVEILSYHGVSLLDFATNIQTLNYNQPTPIMKHMLQKRHLAPAYGGYTPLAPEHIDYMIIDRSPDIFVTGHVHITSIENYRGVNLINASAWQSQTEYQKMMNFVPDPAKLPIVDLKSGIPSIMDFSKPF